MSIIKDYVEYVYGKPNAKKCTLCNADLIEPYVLRVSSEEEYCSEQCLRTDGMVRQADCEDGVDASVHNHPLGIGFAQKDKKGDK